MASLQDFIKYIGIAAIIFFLLKAFSNNKLTNCQILIVVIIIMILVIFLACQNFNCQYKGKEKFTADGGETDLTVKTIEAGPTDFIDLGLNKQQYDSIINRERQVMDQIQSGYENDMVYTSTHPFNTVPLGSQLYGYTYMPPENWYRPFERPPVCITDKPNVVQPVANPSVAGLLEFDSVGNGRDYMLRPMEMDCRYIKDVLNKGVV